MFTFSTGELDPSYEVWTTQIFIRLVLKLANSGKDAQISK